MNTAKAVLSLIAGGVVTYYTYRFAQNHPGLVAGGSGIITFAGLYWILTSKPKEREALKKLSKAELRELRRRLEPEEKSILDMYMD